MCGQLCFTIAPCCTSSHQGAWRGQLGLVALDDVHKGEQHVLLDGHEGVAVRCLEVEGNVDLWGGQGGQCVFVWGGGGGVLGEGGTGHRKVRSLEIEGDEGPGMARDV